jgi:hypothetical protein
VERIDQTARRTTVAIFVEAPSPKSMKRKCRQCAYGLGRINRANRNFVPGPRAFCAPATGRAHGVRRLLGPATLPLW